MKIALLADIHANADALSAVLAAAKVADVDQILVAGDTIGYYYQPDRVFKLLQEWSWTMVRGNHEEMLRDWLAGQGQDDIRRRYGTGLAEAARCLTARQIEDLLALPPTRELQVDGRRVLLCHGSPWDLNAYVYPDAADEVPRRMAAGGHDLVVFGHTHYPVVWELDSARVVNPGSVGQPRDRKPGACWAIWDTQADTVVLRREPYDVSRITAECCRRDPHLPYLADVLARTGSDA